MAADIEPALFALDMAIQTEKDGRAFYLKAAGATHDKRGRRFFQGLADDELGHLAMLEERKERLLRDGKWLPFEKAAASHVPGAPIFDKDIDRGEINAYTSDLSALRVAYLLERDAVGFYSHAAEQTSDPDGKKMYEALVEMEKQHETALETEYRLLSDQFKLWMGFAPF